MLSLEQVNAARTIYLISDDDGDGDAPVVLWVRANYERLFESKLEGWYTDRSLWPEKCTAEMFCDWFGIEWHSVIIDTVGGALYNEHF